MMNKKDILAVIFLLIIIIIRFAPFILFHTPVNTDSWKAYLPWAHDFQQSRILTADKDVNTLYDVWFPMAKTSLAKGEFPYWNPYSFCGTPLFANRSVPIFHIPLALAFLFPSDLIVTAYAFIGSIIGTLFFYFFLRSLRFSIFVSFFGGSVFFLSGWLPYNAPAEMASFIWIPAILLFYNRFLQTGHLINVSLSAFCMGQFLIAGYPICIMHFIYFLAAYFLWQRSQAGYSKIVPTRRWIAGLVLIVTVGMLLSSVQNYPTYNYMKLSNRNVASSKSEIKSLGENISSQKKAFEKKQAKFDIRYLINQEIWKKSMMITPTLDRKLFMNRAFVGPIVILLSLIGLLFAHRRFGIVKFFYIVFGLLFLVSPLYSLAARIVPGWSITYFYPFDVFSFMMYFMAVIGLDYVLTCKVLNKYVIGLVLLVLILQVTLLIPPPVYDWQQQIQSFRWNASLDFFFRILYLLVTVLIVLLIGIHSSIRRLSVRAGFIMIFFYILTGLFAHVYMFPYFADRNPMPDKKEIKTIRNICRDGRICRFSGSKTTIYSRIAGSEILPANIPGKFRIHDICGSEPMMLDDYAKFMNTIAPGHIVLGRYMIDFSDPDLLNPSGFLVQSTGLKYCLENRTTLKIGTPDKSIFGKSIVISEINSARNAFFRFITEWELEKDYTGNPGRDDFRNKVILNEPPYLPDRNILKSGPATKIIDSSLIEAGRTNSRFDLSFDTPVDCILYISESYHPNWRANLDGERVKVLKANLAFCAIAVSKGAHKLEMYYDGSDVRTGGILSILGLAMVIGLFWVNRRNQRML